MIRRRVPTTSAAKCRRETSRSRRHRLHARLLPTSNRPGSAGSMRAAAPASGPEATRSSKLAPSAAGRAAFRRRMVWVSSSKSCSGGSDMDSSGASCFVATGPPPRTISRGVPSPFLGSFSPSLELSSFRGQSARKLWVARPSKPTDVAECPLGRVSSTAQTFSDHGQAYACSPSEACLAVPPVFRRTLLASS